MKSSKMKEKREKIVHEINQGIDYSNGEKVWAGISKLLKLEKKK